MLPLLNKHRNAIRLLSSVSEGEDVAGSQSTRDNQSVIQPIPVRLSLVQQFLNMDVDSESDGEDDHADPFDSSLLDRKNRAWNANKLRTHASKFGMRWMPSIIMTMKFWPGHPPQRLKCLGKATRTTPRLQELLRSCKHLVSLLHVYIHA